MCFLEDKLRLYAVTDRRWLGERTLAEAVEAAIRGGASCIQLREKGMPLDDFLSEARQIAALCRDYNVPLIINDHVEIALQSGADGVHVGQADICAAHVRERIGSRRILGVTAKSVEQALQAQAAGADYLGCGAIFSAIAKPDAQRISKDTLREICRATHIPVVAIGGVNRDNLMELADCGIVGAAVVSGIFAAQDVETECRLLRGMIERIVHRAD